MRIPDDLRYTENHEWVRVGADGVVTVGISEYAQDALGDVVYVDLPEEGREIEAGESFAEVESTKSVNDVYAPVSGTVLTVNTVLSDTPELVNADPYGQAWFVTLAPSNPSQVHDLMDAAAYLSYTEE